MKTVQGFNVLPLKFSAESANPHEIFMKENATNDDDDTKPVGKTLFVMNIPPYATENSLKKVFSKAGKVKNVILEKNKHDPDHEICGFKIAYIVYNKREGLLGALKLTELDPLSDDKEPILIGLKKWVQEYNDSILDHDKLQQEVEKHMAEYDRMEAENKAKEKKVDDDGWTIVTKKGRRPGLARKDSVSKKIIQKAKLKSKKKELKNFYTFQIRDSKMKAVAELRKKYEHDKSKVEAMKKLRKFKPC